eukprot:7596015-Pyramimonas_sp.AAC.1
MAALEARSDVFVIALDYCQYGTPWKKPTKILTSCEDLRSIARTCSGTTRSCSVTRQPHQVLRGDAPCGTKWTKLACPYPTSLCEEI